MILPTLKQYVETAKQFKTAPSSLCFPTTSLEILSFIDSLKVSGVSPGVVELLSVDTFNRSVGSMTDGLVSAAVEYPVPGSSLSVVSFALGAAAEEVAAAFWSRAWDAFRERDFLREDRF